MQSSFEDTLLEHLVAEYKFRDGSVPVAVLIQNQEGRNVENTALARDGIVATLQSKSIIVNALVYGNGVINIAHAEMFDLSPYLGEGGASDVRILGVESDLADGVADGQHNFIGIDNRTMAPASSVGPTHCEALQVSFNGSNTGVTGMVATGKSILVTKSGFGGIGPSSSGYLAIDTKDPGYAMTGAGSSIVAPNSAVTIPFAFPYYNSAYDRLWVSVDGTIRLGNSGSPAPVDPGPENADLSRQPEQGEPARPAFPLIAPLWDDLTTTSHDVIRTRSYDFDGNGQIDFGVEWADFAYDNGSSTTRDENRITFQAVLFADGRIQFNYVDIDNPGATQLVEAGTGNLCSEGVSATVGVWSGAEDRVPLPAGKYVPGPHSVFGSGYDAESGSAETNDRYIRLAWDTGGAAWDLGTIDGIGLPIDPNSGSVNPTLLDAARIQLRDRFLESIGRQMVRRSNAGQVYRADQVMAAYNLGGPAIPSEGFSADPGSGDTQSTSNAVNTSSDAVPLVPGGATRVQQVFKSVARTTGGLTITRSFAGIPNGAYVVEVLFSAPYSSTTGTFDLALEGRIVLSAYQITADYAEIVRPGDPGGDPLGQQYFTVEAGLNTAIVKRFLVDVTNEGYGNEGLQLEMTRRSSADVCIAGVRILRAAAPRVADVVVKGSAWAPGVEYSFAAMVGQGMQLRPIPTQGADTIEIHFDGPVSITADALELARTVRNLPTPPNPNVAPETRKFSCDDASIGFAYDAANYIARWTFPATGPTSLADGKYAVLLNTAKATGSGGAPLDGDWKAGHGFASPATPDAYGDDLPEAFIVGDGASSSASAYFRLNFALLAGDFNGDGAVTTTALPGGPAVDAITTGDRWSDANGDGVVGGADTSIRTTNAGDYLPLRRVHGADFIDDDAVRLDDYHRWKMAYGQSAEGDVDGDGDTDGNDFLLWQVLIGSYSAWSPDEFLSPAASISATGDVTAPQVVNVVVSGSVSLHAPFSFDTVDGSGAQLRTVPVGGADTISIVFSEGVNVAAESLIVVGMTTFNLPELAEFSYDAATHTATWRFEGWALGDAYFLALADEVTDEAGNWLDGEWTNPATTATASSLVSEFPSGDGVEGGWFKFMLTLLPGDANLDNLVDLADYDIYVANVNLPDRLFTQADFNGNGRATFSGDAALMLANFGRDLHQPLLKADFDGDWDVDDADLAVIGAHAGLAGASWADGDLDGDGAVTIDDLDLALAQYGLGLNVVG